MAQIKTKFIEDGAVDETKVKLSNDSFLKGRNAADNADVDIIKVNASDALELAAKLSDPDSSAPTADAQLANKKYVDDSVSAISIPSVFELQGNWDASTNTPTLANTDSGVANYLYYVNAAGSVDFGAGSITFAMGDWVYNVNGAWEKADNNDDVLSVNGQTGVVSLDSDDVAEGATNLYYTEARFDASLAGKTTTDLAEGSSLYFTDARARTAAVLNTLAGSETDQAPSVSAVNAAIAAITGADAETETPTLNATDISNGYKDTAFAGLEGSFHVQPDGGLPGVEGVDYTVAVAGGAGGVARVTFAGDFSTLLADGDVLQIKYLRG